jgi:hypothetical protein
VSASDPADRLNQKIRQLTIFLLPLLLILLLCTFYGEEGNMLSRLPIQGLATLLLISPILAHGDHEHVPEGAGVSEDPIVCHALAQGILTPRKTDTVSTIGLDVMDSYDSHGSVLWDYLSLGHGARCTSA